MVAAATVGAILTAIEGPVPRPSAKDRQRYNFLASCPYRTAAEDAEAHALGRAIALTGERMIPICHREGR